MGLFIMKYMAPVPRSCCCMVIPLVILMNLSNTCHCWSAHYKVIAVGMRGHGKSSIGTKKYSYALFAHDALAVLANEKEGHWV